MDTKNKLFEVVCTAAEFDDIMIRNQAQQLFTFMLQHILDRNLPLREELEILLVKIVLKPALTLAKKLAPQDQNKKASSTSSSGAAQVTSNDLKRGGSFNATSSSSTGVHEDSDNEEFIQVNHERTV